MANPEEKAEKAMYSAIIEGIFKAHYDGRSAKFEFAREEIFVLAEELGIEPPDNAGDLVYSFRYRKRLPASITATAPTGKEWIIQGAGRSKYAFCLVSKNRIIPRQDLVTIKVPNATPEIVAAYAQGDEQALLAKVRYNRLVDIFTGLTTYSLQNHLRTTVKKIGQIEIDEIYVGLDRHGKHYVIPLQAKGGADQLGVVQTNQDLECCKQKYPTLICRPLSAQFMSDDIIAMFELTVDEDQVRVVDEKHYKLVPADAISSEDLASYAFRSPS